MILLARAEARAILYRECEYADLSEAIDPLLSFAEETGLLEQLGPESLQALITAAFKLNPEA